MQKHISDKGLVIEIYKGLLKFNNNKTTQFKIYDRQHFKEDTDMINKPMENAQHYMSLKELQIKTT